MRNIGRTDDHAVFSCQTCENFVLGEREYLQDLDCCNQPLREVTKTAVEPATPSIETIARHVFGVPNNGFEICRYVAEQDAVTVTDVADHFGYERSVITRYLNTMSEIGLLKKTARVRKGGGEVNVYYPLPTAELNRQVMLCLYSWSVAAAEILRDATETGTELEVTHKGTDNELAAVLWE